MSKKMQSLAPADVLPAFDQEAEVSLTREVFEGLKSFALSVVPFMKRAAELEAGARKRLQLAEALVLPIGEAADVSLQQFVKACNADKKTIEEHWTITSVLHNFQRRLVAHRTRATDMLDRSAKLGNGLHNEYVEQEKRRAREEEDRRRVQKEHEEKARQEREARRLEEEAIKAESLSDKLSEREQRFCAEYHLGKPATIAAKLAGFKEPERQADRLLASKKIMEALAGLQRAGALKSQAEATRKQPIAVEVAPVRPAVSKAAGAHDRTTYSAELVDEQAFVDACLDGTISRDVARVTLQASQTKLNQHARDLREELNSWPGVRLKKSTGVV